MNMFIISGKGTRTNGSLLDEDVMSRSKACNNHELVLYLPNADIFSLSGEFRLNSCDQNQALTWIEHFNQCFKLSSLSQSIATKVWS